MSIINKIRYSEKTNISNIKKNIQLFFKEDVILMKWSPPRNAQNNFGDVLNPWLVEKITHKTPININTLIYPFNKIVYSSIGSNLDDNITQNLIVWGSGFRKINGKLNVKPEKVLAVRGPLTRKKLLELGVDCPEVYGDPALLLPIFYKPKILKKYKIGIIPHYIDKHNKNFLEFKDKLPNSTLVIDIEDKIETVIHNILQCESIASSSLHGIIVADAYNIPSTHIKFSNNVSGGEFKFKDYMSSVKRNYEGPLIVNKYTTLDDIYNEFTDYTINIDLEKLISTCPFKKL